MILNENFDSFDLPEKFVHRATKDVVDADGFMTEYHWYYNPEEDVHYFYFGDPMYGYEDWTAESEETAKEWFDNYKGFEDADEYDDYTEEEMRKMGAFDNLNDTEEIDEAYNETRYEKSDYSVYYFGEDETLYDENANEGYLSDFRVDWFTKPGYYYVNAFGDDYIRNEYVNSIEDFEELCFGVSENLNEAVVTGWVLVYDNGDHDVYWTADDNYTDDINDKNIMIYRTEEEALSDVTHVKNVYEKLTDFDGAIFKAVPLNSINVPLTEAVVTGGNYTITYYLNTACKERRPETAEDVENDYNSENFTCADDFSAMLQAYLVHREDRNKYRSNEDILQAYELDFKTAEDVKEYFDFCDIGDGSVIVLKVEQNDRVVYDSGMDLDYFMNGVEESLTETKATGVRGRYQVEVFDEGDWHKLSCWSDPVKAMRAGEDAVEAVYQDYRVVDKETGEEIDYDDYYDQLYEGKGREMNLLEYKQMRESGTLPADSAYLHARTGDKVTYEDGVYEVNADEGKIGYSDKIGLTCTKTGNKIVVSKADFVNKAKMYKGECLNEGRLKDLVIDMENEVKELTDHINYLETVAKSEVGRGGAFDSVAEVDEAIAAAEAKLNDLKDKLAGNKPL